MKFFNGQTANGSSVAMDWFGGGGTFSAWGTWGGATLKLEWSPNGGATWIPVGVASTFISDGVANFTLGVGKIRATLSGATGTTSLSATV